MNGFPQSLLERINIGEFEGKPFKDFETEEMAQLGLEAFIIKDEIDKAKTRLAEVQNKMQAARRVAVKACNQHRADKLAEFKTAAFTEVGIPVDHPKAELVWTMAWERNHSLGYHAVLSALEDIAGLIL